jgi:hypothetical protein
MQIEYASARQLASLSPLQVEGTLVVMPFTNPDQARHASEMMAKRADAKGCILNVLDDVGLGFVKTVNAVFKNSHSDFFAYVAQDIFPGRAWLSLALAALESKQGGLLGFNDGKWAGAIASFGLARRTWAQNNYHGDFFYSQYKQHYADAELTLLAMQAGLYRYEPNSVIMEIDWQKEQSTVRPVDRQLFLARQEQGFDAKVSNPKLLNWVS